MTAEHSPEQLQRWQRELARKGMDLYAVLSEGLAGKNATLAMLKLPHEQKPGEQKEERLRRFLDQVSRAQKRMQIKPGEQGDAWVRCARCRAPLPDVLLDEAPWTEVCGDCEPL